MGRIHDDGALLTPRAAQFLSEHIDSVDALELMLFLWRERARAWDTPRLAAELRVQIAVVDRILRRLGSKNIIATEDGQTQWGGAGDELDDVVAAIAAAYERHTLEVIRIVNEREIQRTSRRARGSVTFRNLRD
jgi:hypothetical protein